MGQPAVKPAEPGVEASLLRERRLVQQQVAGLDADHAEILAAVELVATDDEHDPEGATIAFERERIVALLGQSRQHLEALDRALDRLRAGGYGECRRCGGAISAARLAARPAAETCITCATPRR